MLTGIRTYAMRRRASCAVNKHCAHAAKNQRGGADGCESACCKKMTLAIHAMPPSVISLNKNAGDARGTSGFGTLTASFHQGYESTQPPEPLLNALLHNDCTGNFPVDKVMSAAAPCPEEIHAHLSPFSAPPESSQPPFGNWSVIVSAISWPPTMVMPASGPRPLKLAPQLAPASVMYGRFV